VAVVLFALNGQGLGHIIRSTVVSHALASVGERPVIFSGGQYRPAGLEQFPVRVVPSLWGAADDVRLNETYSGLYSAFLLCDAPDSPTWPYDQAQSRTGPSEIRDER